jgi:hypothetical protein
LKGLNKTKNARRIKMGVKIEVVITAPEIEEALLRLAGADSQEMKEGKEEAINVGNVDKSKEDVYLEEQRNQIKAVTLEELRGKLINLSREGKHQMVSALISKYGASKLSDIKEEKYAEMLREVEKC